MTDSVPRTAANHSPRGLATIAYLKTRFNEGVDHLAMFEPFVEAAIDGLASDEMEISDVGDWIKQNTGLTIPGEILKSLLRRSAKKDRLERHGGRYFRIGGPIAGGQNVQAVLQDMAAEQRRLGLGLRDFGKARGQEIPSADAALSALMRFLDANHIGIVLGQPLNRENNGLDADLQTTIAAFVAGVARERSTPEFAILNGIVQGLIVLNALLLRDIPTRRNLDGLTAFLDSGLLLQALGLTGEKSRETIQEALRIVRESGARLRVFQNTLNEMARILRVHEERLGSPNRMRTLRQTPLTRHFLGIGASPADVRQEIALMQNNLERMGIRVHQLPRHQADYTEDDNTLAELLRDPDRPKGSDDDRVWHDVDAVAAVLTLRAGVSVSHVGRAKYAFVSDSGHTVRNVEKWCRETKQRGLAPMVHFRSLVGTAWVGRPTEAPDVPMAQLVAVCAGMLRPSEEVWSKFIGHLEQLVESGELTDDESIVILASELTQEKVSSGEFSDDTEAESFKEVIDRVRGVREEKMQTRLEYESRERASLESGIRSFSTRLTKFVIGMLQALLFAGAAAGGWLSVSTEWADTPSSLSTQVTAWIFVAMFLGLSLLPALPRRFDPRNALGRLETWLERRIRKFVAGGGKAEGKKGERERKEGEDE